MPPPTHEPRVEGLPCKDSPPEVWGLVATSPAHASRRSPATMPAGGDASQRSPPIAPAGLDASKRSPPTPPGRFFGSPSGNKSVIAKAYASQRTAKRGTGLMCPLPRPQPLGDASQRTPVTIASSAWGAATASVAATRAAAAACGTAHTQQAPQQASPHSPSNASAPLSLVATSPPKPKQKPSSDNGSQARSLVATSPPTLKHTLTSYDASQRAPTGNSMVKSFTVSGSPALDSSDVLTSWLAGASSLSGVDIAEKLRVAAPEVYED